MAGPMAGPTRWKFSKRMFWTTPLVFVSTRYQQDWKEGERQGWKRREGGKPSTTTRKSCTFVPRLRNQSSDPGFDISRVMHIVVVGEDLSVFYKDVDH